MDMVNVVEMSDDKFFYLFIYFKLFPFGNEILRSMIMFNVQI